MGHGTLTQAWVLPPCQTERSNELNSAEQYAMQHYKNERTRGVQLSTFQVHNHTHCLKGSIIMLTMYNIFIAMVQG